MKLLIIEDDLELCAILEHQLKKKDITADFCNRGDDAAYYYEKQSYDTIVLDRMLPGKDGLSILKEIRRKQIATPVIMLTALDTLQNRVEGLDGGADDYLTKPFEVEELLARIRALSRRTLKIESQDSLAFGDIVLDVSNLTITSGEKQCVLSKRECDLLNFFMKNKGQVLTRETLLTRVWGADSFVTDGNLDNFICFLRKRLKVVESSVNLKTVRGVGYRLEET